MKNHKKITKAVIAAAGYGTRFLPATKNQPKEMLPIIDKPIIHYLVEEAVNSGITDIVLVTRAGQHIMEDYFDSHSELETALGISHKEEMLEKIREIPKMANFIYIRQNKHFPYGNASPLLAARSVIDDDESIVYMFGDDLTISKKPITKQLIDFYQEHHPTMITAAYEVPKDQVYRYGIVEPKENPTIPYEISRITEKPAVGEIASNRAQDGRFILSPKAIAEIDNIKTGKDNELWLTDLMQRLTEMGEAVCAPPLEGEWLTTGDPLNYLKTTVKFALHRDDINGEFVEFLKEVIK